MSAPSSAMEAAASMLMAQTRRMAGMNVTPTLLAPLASGMKQLVAMIMPTPVETAPKSPILLCMEIAPFVSHIMPWQAAVHNGTKEDIFPRWKEDGWNESGRRRRPED